MVFSVFSIFSFAQKNKIEAGLSSYKYFNVVSTKASLFDMLQISYHRKLNDNISSFISYNRAPLLLGNSHMSDVMIGENYITSTEKKNHTRSAYNFFDLGLSYSLWKFKKHQVSLKAGLSYAYGKNEYSALKFDLLPMDDVILTTNEVKYEGYLGALFGAQYDYNLWKDRIDIGAHFLGRYYVNHFPFQINFGLQIGYKF